jgi:hypothetical protein
MDPLWFAITAVAAVALVVVVVRTFLFQIGGKDVLFGKQRLEVREADGFAVGERDVEIAAEVANRGGAAAQGAVIEALVDGAVVASSLPVDVAQGQSAFVRLAIPRRFVRDMSGERPLYEGDFSLRVAGR